MKLLSGLADAVRCAWALVYWNTRKTLFVLGGRRGNAPCQNPSDIGGPHGVRCDACLDLAVALRFRRVCPLLVAGPDGRGGFCSVPASRVRPFWGRALAVFGGGALLLYLGGATLAFVGLRATGVTTLSWTQVAWPGLWREIPQERSKYFLRQGLLACVRRDYPAAYRGMVTAVALDPYNYDARLLVAQYAAYAGENLVADRLFALLSEGFEGQRERTAVTYHDTLLAVGCYDALARHCLQQAQVQATRPQWVNALLLALYQGRLGPGFVAENNAAVDQLGPDAGRLVQAVAALSAGDPAGAVLALRHTLAPATAGAYVLPQIQLLLKIGAPADAEMAWTVNAQTLPEFDRVLARCWIDAGQGYGALAALEFSALVDRASGPVEWDQLAATLVIQPNREALGYWHRRALRAGDQVTREQASLLWVAALVCGAEVERDVWARYLAERLRVVYPSLSGVNFTSNRGDEVGSVPFLVNLAPLGRNTIASLYWRMTPPVPTPVILKPRGK